MGAVRIAIFAVAAIVAIVLAFFVRGMVAPKKVPPPVVVAAAPARPMANVLVAGRDLRRSLEIEKSFLGESLYEVVEEFGELFFRIRIAFAA